MVLKDLLSIAGQGGLFKFVSQARNGVIVENIETKKRTSIPATAKMSSLEDIAIFTENEEVPLAKIMDNLFEKEKGGETISHKSDNDQLKKLMSEILPEYDKERVYVSDIKKLVQWYNLLQKQGLLVKEEEKKEDEKKEEEDQKAVKKAEKKDKLSGIKNPKATVKGGKQKAITLAKTTIKPKSHKPKAVTAMKKKEG